MLQLVIAITAISLVAILGLSTILMSSAGEWRTFGGAGAAETEAGRVSPVAMPGAIALVVVAITTLVGVLAMHVSPHGAMDDDRSVRIWSTGSSIR